MRQKTLRALCAVLTLAGCLEEETNSGSGAGGPLSGAPAVGVAPGANSVVMDGFFLGPGFAVFFSAGGDAKFTTKWPTLVDEFDIAAASATDPKNAGKWRTRGDKLIIDFGGGYTWVCRLVSADQFQIESGRKGGEGSYVTRPPRVPQSITGSFKQGNFSDLGMNMMMTGNNSVEGNHWLTFKNSDTIVIYDELVTFFNGEVLTSQTTVEADYVIDGYTITITERNGKVTRKDIWVRSGTAENPTHIRYGNSVYEAR